MQNLTKAAIPAEVIVRPAKMLVAQVAVLPWLERTVLSLIYHEGLSLEDSAAVLLLQKDQVGAIHDRAFEGLDLTRDHRDLAPNEAGQTET